MSKQILPNELAEIVTGLLIKPGLLGELDTAERHQRFLADIANVVADHCGGEIFGINEPDTYEHYLANIFSSPFVSVRPNDSLPSLHTNVWAAYDPDGWEVDIASAPADVELGTPMEDTQAKALRKELQQLASEAATRFSSNPKQDRTVCSASRVVVLVEGGMVEAVWASGSGIDVTVIDRDNERVGDAVMDIDQATAGLDHVY